MNQVKRTFEVFYTAGSLGSFSDSITVMAETPAAAELVAAKTIARQNPDGRWRISYAKLAKW